MTYDQSLIKTKLITKIITRFPNMHATTCGYIGNTFGLQVGEHNLITPVGL